MSEKNGAAQVPMPSASEGNEVDSILTEDIAEGKGSEPEPAPDAAAGLEAVPVPTPELADAGPEVRVHTLR